jgi:inhibitor of KinA sporulation pathway (predicted exonuclease)
LTVGTYVSDLEITYPDGTVDSTDTFKIEVEADITVEVPAP